MLADHLVVLLVAGVLPLGTSALYRHRFADGLTSAARRRREWLETLAEHALLATAVVTLWLAFDRPWVDLGLRWTGGWRALAAVAVTLALGILLGLQLRAVRRAREVADLGGQLGELAHSIPRNAAEMPLFRTAAISAGIAEELFFRGYLIWYLESQAGLVAAVVGSSLLFAWAHLYQGWRHLPRVFAVGLALAGLYLLGGTLLLPMLIHAWIDLTQGALLAEILRREESGQAGEPSLNRQSWPSKQVRRTRGQGSSKTSTY